MPIDATVGGIASNSYVSLEDANTYFSTRLHAETWTSASDADKEAALITATNIIDWYHIKVGKQRLRKHCNGLEPELL